MDALVITDYSAISQPAKAPLNPVEMLLADKRSAATKRAYKADLLDFFGGAADARMQACDPATVAAFAILPTGEVALRLATYKAELLTRGMAEATINRRLAAVRSLLKLCHRLGISQTDGRGLVDGEKVKSYRDTRGIELLHMKRLLKLPDTSTLAGKRDAALLRLLLENALRRAEVCALAVPDFEPQTRRLWILGKGKGTQKEAVTITPRLVGSISGYLLASGHSAGALFRNLDHRPGHAGEGLTADGLYRIIGDYGERLGIRLTPHKLRHSAITAALDATGGDVRRVQKLSRHADLRTLTIYDDAREDLQGEVSGMLSKLL